jgi:hypothetical protein
VKAKIHILEPLVMIVKEKFVGVYFPMSFDLMGTAR